MHLSWVVHVHSQKCVNHASFIFWLPLLTAICLYSSASDGLQINDNISIKIGFCHIQYSESMCKLLSSALVSAFSTLPFQCDLLRFSTANF